MTRAQDKIGLWPLTSLVTGNLVGSGVYLLPATLAAFGTLSLFGWMITSLGAILLSLVFANLSSLSSKTGGPYVYVREAFGDTAGYYVCWGYWMLSWIGNAALPIGAVGYISTVVGGLTPEMTFALEALILVSIILFNLMGLKMTGRMELVITVLKVIPLLLLPAVGLFFINLDYFTLPTLTDTPLMSALNTVAFLTLWGFVGLETGTVPAGQVLNPKRTVPMATILGTSIAAAVYILGTICVMGVVPPEALLASKAPYADAAQSIFGGNWGTPVALAAVLSCVGTLNGWTIVVGRIPYGAAEDGLFPDIFKKTTAHGTPYVGVLLSGLCTFCLLFLSLSGSLIEQFHIVVDVSVTLILVVYTLCVLAFFKLMMRNHVITPGKIILGIGALCFAGWALWAASLKMVLMSSTLLLLGIPMHLWMKRRQ